jgi:hypothetical protein
MAHGAVVSKRAVRLLSRFSWTDTVARRLHARWAYNDRRGTMLSVSTRRAWVGVGVVVVLLGGLLGGVAIAGHEPDHHVFYACEQNGKVIPGTMMVGQEPTCNGNKTLVSWHSGAPEPEFESCVGTYFVQRFFPDSEGELFYHSDAFWTFSADGTFQGTTSSEHIFEFSHKQGAWTATADFVANMVNLDFEFADDTVARNDAVVTFSPDCTELTAEFGFRSYDARLGSPLGSPPPWTPPEDPLDPGQGTPSSQGLTASGRLLTTP